MNQLPGNQQSPQHNNQDGELESLPKWLHKLMPHGMDLNPTRKVIAEMAGTFILMFCIYGIISITQLLNGQVGLLEYSATAGLGVVIIIFSVGPISGAHVNPAVTIAFAIFGYFPWSQVPFYVIAQITGSSLAALIGSAVYGIDASIMTTRPSHGTSSAFWLELFAMVFIVFTTASISYNSKSVGYLSGFVMGIAIALAVLITAPVSGGSLNPARSLGPAIVSREFKYIWIYMTAPVIGAVMGALLYQIVHLRTKTVNPNFNLSEEAGVLG